MPEGPLFAAGDDDYGTAGGGDDYAYDDDSDDEEDGDDGNGGENEEEEDEGDGEESPSDDAAASKSEFDDSDPSSVERCQPGKKGKKGAKKKICPVATIKKNLDTCDGGTNAWANAKTAAGTEPTVQVKKTKSGFDAETSGSTITIKPTTNCCDATESLLFELHNVESQPAFDKIDSDADSGLYSREDYTRANEKVEYDGLKRSWETFDKCKKKWGCGAGAKSFADGFRKAKNFDSYYKKYLDNGHKNHYRKYWDKQYKAKYAAEKEEGPVRLKVMARLLLWIAIALEAGCGREKAEAPMKDIKKLIESRAPEIKVKLGAATWEFVCINPGEFLMGSPAREPGREDGEVPQMRVWITRVFYLGKYEVTQLQWRSIMGANPSELEGDDLAVDQIHYSSALRFCRKLSTAFGVKLTLPTEAQWEYACRAGTTTRFYTGNAEADLARAAWYESNSEETVHPVGKKEPNAWGLYDMLGNVYEPCIDYITSFRNLKERDPEGNRFADMGAMRGGFYMDALDRCRAAFRLRSTDRFGGMGVRLAINP